VCIVCIIHLAYFLFTNTIDCYLLSIQTHSHINSVSIPILTGAIFDSSSIEVVNDPDGVIVIVVRGFGNDFQVQLAGNRKLRFTPVDDPHYFFHGQCVATSGILEPPVVIEAFADDNGVDIVIPQPVITSQSCKLNMCLGGGGFSCIAIYSGSAFVFNFGKVVAINNSQNGNEEPVTFEAPPLPPPFPGTIIGGKG